MLDFSTLRERSLRLFFAVAAIAWFIYGGAVCAQPLEPPHRHGPERFLEHVCADGDAVLNAHLAFLETKLKPRDDQKQAFASFAGEVRAATRPMRDLCAGGPPRPEPGLLGRMRFMDRVGSAMLGTEKGMLAALEKLVPVLDETQRRTLDELPPPFAPPGLGLREPHWNGGQNGGTPPRLDDPRRP